MHDSCSECDDESLVYLPRKAGCFLSQFFEVGAYWAKIGRKYHSQKMLNMQWCNTATVPRRSLTYWVWSSEDSRFVIMQRLLSLAKWTYWSTSANWFSAGWKKWQYNSRKTENDVSVIPNCHFLAVVKCCLWTLMYFTASVSVKIFKMYLILWC